MSQPSNFAWRAGAILGASGVLLGAFGSHGLTKLVQGDLRKIQNWRTAATYQLIHSAALLAIGAATHHQQLNGGNIAARLMVAGTLGFSGSIYLLTLNTQAFRLLGPVTPLGGLALAGGWLSLLF